MESLLKVLKPGLEPPNCEDAAPTEIKTIIKSIAAQTVTKPFKKFITILFANMSYDGIYYDNFTN